MTLAKVIDRLRGKPPAEIARLVAGRALRAATGIEEQARAGLFGTRIGEREFQRAVSGSAASPAEATAQVERTMGRPLIGPEDAPALRAILDRHPETRAALRAAVQQALSGSYDLLGSGPRALGVKPDWHRDFKSGGRWDPATHHRRLRAVRYDGTDVKVPWELSRLQHLPLLATVYLLDGTDEIPAFFRTQVADWIEKNPPELGVNWSCTMDVAMRATSLAWSWALLHESPAFDGAFRLRFLQSMLEHGRFIETHLENGGPSVGNHFIADLSGLAFLAQSFPGFRAARRWEEVARSALEREIRRQVQPDGSDFEASTSYHRLVLELLLLPALLWRRNGRGPSEDYWRRLRSMFAFSAALQNGHGRVPQFGDNDSGRGFRLVAREDLDHGYLTSLGASVFGDAALCAGRLPDAEAALLAGPATFEAIERGGGVSPGSAAFDAAGIYVLRQGPFELFVRCGDKGQEGLGGHAHNDALSFELSLSGERIVVDPGTGNYTGDPALRNRLRGTRAHATLFIEGREQCPMAEDDLFALPDRLRLIERRLESGASESSFAGEIATRSHRHRRCFLLREGRLEIHDAVSPAAAFELRLPLLPGARPSLDGEVARVGPLRFRFWSEGRALSPEIVEGVYAPCYGRTEPAPVLRVQAAGTLDSAVEIDPGGLAGPRPGV